MHEQNIAHLGLTVKKLNFETFIKCFNFISSKYFFFQKPGDLLISHPGGDDLKLCDFGQSRRIHPGQLQPLEYGKNKKLVVQSDIELWQSQLQLHFSLF